MNELFKKQQEEFRKQFNSSHITDPEFKPIKEAGDYILDKFEDFLSLCQEQWREFILNWSEKGNIKDKDIHGKSYRMNFTDGYFEALDDLREIFNIKE